MKKVFKYLLLTFILTFSFILNTNAEVLTQDEARQRVIDSEAKARNLIEILTSWSNSYGANLEDIISRDLIGKVDSLNSNAAFDLIVRELNAKGYASAAGALNLKKSEIMADVDYLKESQALLKEYFNANVSGGVVGSRKLFVQIEDSFDALKTPIKDLINIYYDSFSNKLLNKVDSYSSVEDIRSFYNEMLDKISELDSEVSSLKKGFSDWQDLYNKYCISDYEDYIKEEFGDYYRKLDNLYKKVYEKLENKFQSKLDTKIQKIITDTHTETDYSNADNVMERNNRLWDIIDYIVDLQEEVQEKFEDVNSYIKINTAMKYIEKYETQIIDRLIEATDYTKSYLIDNLEITVKNKSDEKLISINPDEGLIIYYDKALAASAFISKLKASYGTLRATKTYNGNIGTMSEVEALYDNEVLKALLVIVKGDVDPTGKIDITDIVNVCNKMFGKNSLSKYEFIAADMNDDSKIDITDIVMLCNKMFK